MQAEILAIGDELTSGQRLDTNSQWLSQRLEEIGVEVIYHTTVGDDLERHVEVFRTAMERVDVVVTSGGLGPTADDLTREAMAGALGVELAENADALQHIRSMFATRGVAMPERNALQALFPVGGVPIPNPHGTAPGIQAAYTRPEGSRCHLFALPGVPAELHEMWHQSVAAAILGLESTPRVLRHRLIKCFGTGESQLEAMLPDLIRRGREPRVGITASSATLTLRVTTSGPDEATCLANMEQTAAAIYQAAGQFVFGEGEIELEHIVAELLEGRGETLATDDAFTGGLLSQWLLGVDPQQRVFRGGLSRGRVIEPEVSLRARIIRQQLGATYGLSVAATSDDRVAVALSDGGVDVVEYFSQRGHPAVVQSRIGKSALNLVRLHLLQLDTPQRTIGQ